MTGAPSTATWWQRAVVYHIYPRSIKDTTGNGVGDLGGIIQSLDYIGELGVDAIWISPFYPSPMRDFGYDVSDYCDVDPLFGSLESFDELLKSAHKRGLKILLDYIPNHTSDEHAWFVEARSARGNPMRDWYIWRDSGPDGGVPNNWLSYFGGSAWTWDVTTRQYYLHSFSTHQPDLNWRNPEVVETMHDVLRFWLNRGVDGFRVDAVLPVIVDDQFRENPPGTEAGFGRHTKGSVDQIRKYNANRPEVHGVLRGMRKLVDSYPGDRVTIGEVYTMDPEIAGQYYGRSDELHLVLNATLVNLTWDAMKLRHYVEAFDAALPEGAWPTLVLGSHDEPRLASRWGEREARVAAVMLLTLRGTPIIYYGDELGMLDGDLVESLDPYPTLAHEPSLSRDVARTPMQWNTTENAGFSTATPWLPVHPRSVEVNVETGLADPRSLLNLYRDLLTLRHNSKALVEGEYEALDGQPTGTYVYARHHGNERLLVALNFRGEPAPVSVPGSGTVLVSSEMDRADESVGSAELTIRGHEGIIVRLD